MLKWFDRFVEFQIYKFLGSICCGVRYLKMGTPFGIRHILKLAILQSFILSMNWSSKCCRHSYFFRKSITQTIYLGYTYLKEKNNYIFVLVHSKNQNFRSTLCHHSRIVLKGTIQHLHNTFWGSPRLPFLII